MGRRRSGERKRPRVGMGTPRLFDSRIRGSCGRTSAPPSSISSGFIPLPWMTMRPNSLAAPPTPCYRWIWGGKVRREVSVCQIGTPRRLHFARVVSASRGVPRFSRRGTRDGDGAGRTLATFLTLPTSPDISPKDRGVRPSAGRCDQRSHFTGAPLETEPCPAVSLLVKSPETLVVVAPSHSCGALE